jgi:hypothetical protein
MVQTAGAMKYILLPVIKRANASLSDILYSLVNIKRSMENHLLEETWEDSYISC